MQGVVRSRREPSQFASELFSGLPARYDLLGYLLSFGQDRRWRRATVDRVRVGPDALVLDVATGPGGIGFAVRRATGATVVGLDLTGPMLARARRNIARRADTRFHLVQGDGQRLPFADGCFDAVTFSYLLRYVADPQATLAELARVLKPGGTLASLEFAVPPSRRWRAPWWLYTRLVLPVAGGLLGGRQWFEVGRFLGPSISRHYGTYPVEWTENAWRQAGCRAVGSRFMSVGGGLVMWGVRASPGGAGHGSASG